VYNYENQQKVWLKGNEWHDHATAGQDARIWMSHIHSCN